jgi:hypothetical protein
MATLIIGLVVGFCVGAAWAGILAEREHLKRN